jgi:transcriptional regulator with XRE-family HTH domain
MEMPYPSDDVTKLVADEVRALAARRRTTQVGLADVIGLSQAAVSRRLRGEIPFTVDELAKVATHFEVPLGSLLPEQPEPAA